MTGSGWRKGQRPGRPAWDTWGTAALPVPDVIEEMVSRVLEDGGDVPGSRQCLVLAPRLARRLRIEATGRR